MRTVARQQGKMLELVSGPNKTRSPLGTVARELKPGHYFLQHYPAI